MENEKKGGANMEKPTRANIETAVLLVLVLLNVVMWGPMLKIQNVFAKEPNTIIAVFTMVLVIVTVAYVYVTGRLLKHSKDALLAGINIISELQSNLSLPEYELWVQKD